jgi:pSer/pThr/pTyr-binding forkhead associated (FHA) protein
MGAPALEVSVDSGETSMVGALLLIGRAPSRGDKESHAKLLTVNDPSLSVSKTHLAIGVDPAGLWVIDRHSTNGTWIDEGLGELRPVEPGVRTTVPPGARVLIGERVLSFSRAR